MDQSGSARSAFIIAEQSIQKKDFLESLQKLISKKAPKYAVTEFKKDDEILNQLYQKTQGSKPDLWGTITKEGIKSTQKAWIEYRDAWVAFCKIKFIGFKPYIIFLFFLNIFVQILKQLFKNYVCSLNTT